MQALEPRCRSSGPIGVFRRDSVEPYGVRLCRALEAAIAFWVEAARKVGVAVNRSGEPRASNQRLLRHASLVQRRSCVRRRLSRGPAGSPAGYPQRPNLSGRLDPERYSAAQAPGKGAPVGFDRSPAKNPDRST